MAGKKPKRVGAYTVVDALGKGGMGEVYLAHHDLLDRKVALKRLTGPDDPEQKEHFEERFRREGRALAKLHHQGIVDVYDLFTWRNDYYMALEYVEGFDCLQLLKRSPFFPTDVCALIAVRMAEALEHAHFNRIVHRDIKPANVMVSKSGDVRLMDFGVARNDDLDKVTRTGMMVGTPMYLAPEVVTGVGADERSDIYSLGCQLYQMLSGRRIFENATADNIYHLIVQGKFPAVGKVQPGIPRVLRKITAKCLERKPEKRYQSAAELRAALDRFLTTHGAWANSNERLVAFLAMEGHISDDEALTVIDADDLVFSKEIELVDPDIKRNRWVGFGLTIIVVLLLVGWLGGSFESAWTALRGLLA